MILNLGVDFGTSSTQVFCRNLSARRDQQLSVLGFGSKGKDLTVPSTLRIKAGKVWFGRQAEALVGGQALRSLKVCVSKLDALSPLAVLVRGFAIAENDV